MKKISLIIFSIFLSFLIVNKVDASSATISVYSSKSTVIVGDTVTVTVKVSSSANLGSWNFDVVPSSNLTFVSSSFGGLYVAESASSLNTKSKTYTFKFKAKSSGTGSVSIKNARVLDMDTEKNMSVSAGKTSFKMMTQSELESTYSKNNNLSSLKIEGYDLEFNKDTLEYNIDLNFDVKEINVIAEAEDSKSSIDGDGKVTLSQGMNQIKIVVTAQNGSTKTYVINANVKEMNPIEVTLDGNTYTVVRQKEFLPVASMYYQETTIKINEEDVPAYYNQTVDFTLVGLKDSNGNVNLYLYKDGNYTLYNEANFNSLGIYILNMDESLIPKGYVQTKINVGDKEVVAYSKDGYEYPLIYGLNLENGSKNLYKYDVKENTLQRYENVTLNEDLYFNALIGMFGFIIVSYIIFIVLLSNKNKQQKNILDKTMRMNIIDVNNNALENVLGVKTKKELKKEKKLAKKLAKKNKVVVENIENNPNEENVKSEEEMASL